MIAESVDLCLERDFASDFDVLVAGIAKSYRGPPYAFVRFADGETAILRGEFFEAQADAWRVQPGLMPNLSDGLQLALTCELPGWHVGITAEAHHPRDHAYLLEHVAVPLSRVSFAEIFAFSNWKRFKEIDISHCRIIGAGAKKPRGYAIPLDAVEDDEFDIEPIIEWMNNGKGPILLSAGPLGKRIAYEYWWTATHCGLRRDVCLDVGSALSPVLRKRRTRKYHSATHPLHCFTPRWKFRKVR